MKTVLAIIIAALLLGTAHAEGERMTTVCAEYDLTGRRVVNVILSEGETLCVYKRPKYSNECPTTTPRGWTVVGKIDAPRNKDKVTCVYHDLGGSN